MELHHGTDEEADAIPVRSICTAEKWGDAHVNLYLCDCHSPCCFHDTLALNSGRSLELSGKPQKYMW